MEKELKNLKVEELSNIYFAVTDFLGYLDKQYEETEKMRDDK